MVCQSIRQIDGLKGPMLPCASCETLRRVPRERRDRMRRRAHRYRARRRRRGAVTRRAGARLVPYQDRKSTRLNSSHVSISYAVFCLKKKKKKKKKKKAKAQNDTYHIRHQ